MGRETTTTTMASGKLLFLYLLLIFLQASYIDCTDDTVRKPYIVYLGDAPKSSRSRARDEHHSLLRAAIGDERTARESMIHSYLKSFNAFAARLKPEEAEGLSDMDGIVSVFPNKVRKLHTTGSWNFLGFPMDVPRSVGRESNVIVGVIDSGIWPYSPSFDDKGVGPPPAKWRGKCEKNANFSCNNKIVGARYFHLESKVVEPPDVASPVDTDGHGTHTSSTVAGVPVERANMYGFAEGTARGGVPSARIAVYKVCWANGCEDVNLLAAFDQAIHDGVDLLSVSIGGPDYDFFTNTISIGSFHAMRRGILTSCSAGNDGPYLGTVGNSAPWILTVAATSIDRQFRTEIGLGNGQKIRGISINTYSPAKRIYPLTTGTLAAKNKRDSNAAYCARDTLDKAKVRGKVVFCGSLGYEVENSVKSSGGSGVIMEDSRLLDVAFTTTMPSATVGPSRGAMIYHYINSTRNPQAVVYRTREINISIPHVTSFSSRGPNPSSRHILKPDIAAPGLDIIAAYTRLSTVTGDVGDDRVTDYNIISGTSMSCPHATAAAAYVKSIHPRWSPAAIKSAIMTTAKKMTPTRKSGSELGYGSGQIDPLRARDPGLVYDLNETSYIRFLCKEGYDGKLIGRLAGGRAVNCTAVGPAAGADGLNYPTMHHQVKRQRGRFSTIFRRTVTNVGRAGTIYKAAVRAPKGISVTVTPSTLVFDRTGQKRSFEVVVKGDPLGERLVLSASLVWRDLEHTVRSPIVITPTW